MASAPRSVIREARLDDLNQLLALEQVSFPAHRQSSRRSLVHSLRSHRQRCVVIEELNGSLLGSMICFLHSRSLRIYSIAITPHARGLGLGAQLIEHARSLAQHEALHRVTLEVDANDEKLCAWYSQQGFVRRERLVDYYAVGQDAHKMTLDLPSVEHSEVKTLIITYHPKLWKQRFKHVYVLSPRAYLSDQGWQRREGLRVINLCAPYRDQRLGYYTSLLGVARNHRVIPNVIMIKDLSQPRLSDLLPYEADQALQRHMVGVTGSKCSLLILFERCAEPKLAPIAKLLSRYIEVPLFQVLLERVLISDLEGEGAQGHWRMKRVQPLTLAQATRLAPALLERAAPAYLSRQRFHKRGIKHEKYDLAVLIDPKEATPPSCGEALEKLRRAAEEVGFYVEVLTLNDAHRVAEFDALFIRTTTRVNHMSYRISRQAAMEGLIVIDDPWSILKCSNKVYLYERLARARIRQPKSWVFLSGAPVSAQALGLSFPLVLKHPEGCFSKGVFKLDHADQLEPSLKLLFEDSDLIIGQEFIPSDFDWRVGVINYQPLFACRYYMASGHWQIYNWASDDQERVVGGSETVSLSEVPKAVLNTAVRAASLMGDGLYGVDLKEVNGAVYVIEVNDNPNIDAGIEDAIEGSALYQTIALNFLHMIERARGLTPSLAHLDARGRPT